METDSQKLKIYFDLLKNAPKRVVLMSPKEDEVTLYKKHIDEAKLYMPYVYKCTQVLDLGSGSGFPGIPLAIELPYVKFYLLDKRKVHIEFLRMVKDTLHLDNVELIHMDAALLKRTDYNFDCVVARAVNRIGTILDWVSSNVVSGGQIILGKKKDIEKELKDIKYPFELSELKETTFGYIVVINKLQVRDAPQ